MGQFILKASRNKYEKFAANHYHLSQDMDAETNIYKDKFFDSSKKKKQTENLLSYGPNVKNQS